MKTRLIAILFAFALVGCASPTPSLTAAPTQSPTLAPTATEIPTDSITLTPPPPAIEATPAVLPTVSEVPEFHIEVVNRYPHDPTAFTQGLLWAAGLLYESTGYYQVSLREIDLTTGEILRSTPSDPNFFGEGLALVGNEFIQITWQEQTALRTDRTTFEPLGTFSYIGEGWGLCFDGTYLYMSDGSSTITVRDPSTFASLNTISVTLHGLPITQLNELECVGDSVYANVWFSEDIMQIDKQTGEVIGVVDASGLLSPDEKPSDGNAVLNGIAYIPERDTFLLTGKLWPALFEVKFIPTE